MMSRDPFQLTLKESSKDLELQPPEFLSDIPVADWTPAKRKPDQRIREKSRFLQLLPENQTRLEKVATRLQVPQYELIRYLLSYSLTAHRTEQLKLEHQLTRQGLSLYPLQVKRRRRKRSCKLTNTSVRGLPDELWQVIKNIAEKQLQVPLWQVINRFIEFGLESYERGALHIQPEAVAGYSLYG